MKVTIKSAKRQTLSEFADEHRLEMVVTERSPSIPAGMRWYAHFELVDERSSECTVTGTYGNGPTPEAAMADYARQISEKRLVYDAFGHHGGPRDIYAPVILPDETPQGGGGRGT